MKRIFILVLSGLMSLAGAVQGQSVKLQSHEISALLTGNTAVGHWEGQSYRQYFGEDGITIYAAQGARSARGEWRVSDDASEYQSIWPGDTEWEGWLVMEYAGTYFWVSKTTPPTPFRIEEGKQLNFP